MSINALGIEIREAARARRLATEAEAAEANQRATSLDRAHSGMDLAGEIIQAQEKTISGLYVVAACGWAAALVAGLASLANAS